jgi:Glycosyl hydrolases family 16
VPGRLRLTVTIAGLAVLAVAAGAVPLFVAGRHSSSAARPDPCPSPEPGKPRCDYAAAQPLTTGATSPSAPAVPLRSTLPSTSAMPRRSHSQPTSSHSASTAAARYGWTKLVAREDFFGTSLPDSWGAYDGPASGDGVWSPEQIRVAGGVARLTGTPEGKTSGMYWKGSQKYGRWEIRARFPAGCGCYTPLLILWPHDNEWPAGGEIDYAEVFNGDRQEIHFNLHYGSADNVIHRVKRVDMTRWRNFAVEWTPNHISWYIDGNRYFTTTQRSAQPPEKMFQTIQLGYDGDKGSGTATMEIDWATKYAL